MSKLALAVVLASASAAAAYDEQACNCDALLAVDGCLFNPTEYINDLGEYGRVECKEYTQILGRSDAYIDLSGANLRGAQLPQVTLAWVNLKDADLSYAVLGGTTMNSCNLQGIKIEQIQAFSIELDDETLHSLIPTTSEVLAAATAPELLTAITAHQNNNC
jgi:hypothetical protein